MKHAKQFLCFNSELISILLFLLSAIIALYWPSTMAIIFYLLMIAVVLFLLKPFSFLRVHLKKISFFLSLGTLIYLYFSRQINNIELWGDEIGVIKIAHLPFKYVVSQLSQQHIAVPPLDYWNLWFWKFIAILFPPNYAEIAYRIPYMIFHCLSAILFSLTVEKMVDNSSKLFKSILSLVAFLTYFFNPILFLYSMEVRYYSLTALGAMVIIYLFLEKKLFYLKYLPLLLLFCLNSVFQFILLAPFVVYGLFDKNTEKGKLTLLFASLILMAALIRPILLIPPPVSNQQSINLILASLKLLINSQFRFSSQYFLTIALIFLPLFFKKFRKESLFLISLFPFYMSSIILISFYKGYFDFYVRHYVFAVPLFLYILFQPLKIFTSKQSYLFITIIFIAYTLFWASEVKHRLSVSNVFSKAPIGNKKVLQLAKNDKYKIIIVPNVNDSFSNENYKFCTESFLWYANQFYPLVKISTPNNINEACLQFEENSHSILFSISGPFICANNIAYQEERLFGSVLGISALQK